MSYKTAEKRNEYAAKYRAAKRTKLFSYLLEHPCVECGEDDPVVLEFDHLPEFEKSFEIGRAVTSSTRSWESILIEMEKCEVVCCNCHRRRTFKRKGTHRTNSVGFRAEAMTNLPL